MAQEEISQSDRARWSGVCEKNHKLCDFALESDNFGNNLIFHASHPYAFMRELRRRPWCPTRMCCYTLFPHCEVTTYEEATRAILLCLCSRPLELWQHRLPEDQEGQHDPGSREEGQRQGQGQGQG